MPGIHSPITRDLFTLDGNVLTSGGDKNLAKGQFAVVNTRKPTPNGAAVVSNFAGAPDSATYAFRVGNHKVPTTRDGMGYAKHKSTPSFTIKDILKIEAKTPKILEQLFDQVVVGYDGINADTAISLDEKQNSVLDVILSGAPIEYKTGQKQYLIKLHFTREEGETNQETIYKLLERLKKETLPGGESITNFVDFEIVDSSLTSLVGTPCVYSTLVLTDNGESPDLARVQAQYPDYPVKLTNRNGLRSTYTILHPESVTLADYNQIDNSLYIKGCADCIAGYSAIDGGFVYSVTIEDDGADQTSLIDDLPGFVTDSVIRHGNKDGKGLYTVVVDDELTDAEITTFINTSAITLTATIELLGEVSDVCLDENTTTVSWVAEQTCFAQVDSYNIQLKDNECGASRLSELQAYYPNLTIQEGRATGNASQTITLTGTSGTATISIAGTDYIATFDTDLTTTATAFVTDNSAALTALGITVTSDAAVITLEAATQKLPASIANATGDLAGTASAVTYEVEAAAGGCQRVYSTQVTTEVSCENCDPIFAEPFMSDIPEQYEFTSWEKVVPASDENALMGIRMTGKPFTIHPTDVARDQIGFYETSVTIEAAGGYIEEVNESFGNEYNNPFSVRRPSRKQDRDSLGYHLLQWEDVSNSYFDGKSRHRDNIFARQVLGEESVLKFYSQYVSYDITIADDGFAQGFGSRNHSATTYKVWAEVGYHENLENIINSLAARAGLAPVQPLAQSFS